MGELREVALSALPAVGAGVWLMRRGKATSASHTGAPIPAS